MTIGNWMKGTIVPILTLMLLSSMFLSTEAAIDKASIVGIWLFDEGSGNKVKDSSDNGNHGNLVNKPEWDNDGKFGKALSFETAKSSYALVPLSHSNSITVAAWAKYTALPTTNIGLFHAQASEDQGGNPNTKVVGIWVENTKMLWGRLIGPDNAKKNFPKTKALDAKKWYHIAVTADAKTKKGKQYVDGELISEIDYTGKLGDFAFAKIGRQGTETWEGSIDEVAIFDQPLAKADIEEVMQGLETVLAVSCKGKLTSVWSRIKIAD